MIIAYDKETGKLVSSNTLQLTNQLLKFKEERNPWEVIDLCVKAFREKYPQRYKSYVVRLEGLREEEKETRVGNRYFKGVSKDKEHDAYLAHTVDFPVWIMQLIRRIYSTDELIMDKEFFREFGARHPEFRIMSSRR